MAKRKQSEQAPSGETVRKRRILKKTESINENKSKKSTNENESEYFTKGKSNDSQNLLKKLTERKNTITIEEEGIVKYFERMQMGEKARSRKAVKKCIINQVKDFRVYKATSPFDRRVTFLMWHPTNPQIVAVASKGGDIILWDYETEVDMGGTIRGIGAGGSVKAMKFDPRDPIQIYTVSLEGKFMLLNFLTKDATEFLDTNDFNKWYVSFDVNHEGRTMVAGDNEGYLTFMTSEGQVLHRSLAHKRGKNITHIEFNRRQPWMLCTASNDKLVKIWDIRSMRDKAGTIVTQPLHTLNELTPVNSAYFSLTDSCRLLTTDQHHHINVYRAPLWSLERSIVHPHRQFQHLTPIKAHWHPLEDIIVVGRYPDPKLAGYEAGELRTIDLIDAASGDMLHQHCQSGFTNLSSVNRFNITGSALATGCGRNVLIWTQKTNDAMGDIATRTKKGKQPPLEDSRYPSGVPNQKPSKSKKTRKT